MYCEKCARSLHEEEEHKCRETNCFYCKANNITGDGEKCNEYRKELKIMNKMMEEKWDPYEAKGILDYRKGKKHMQQL